MNKENDNLIATNVKYKQNNKIREMKNYYNNYEYM